MSSVGARVTPQATQLETLDIAVQRRDSGHEIGKSDDGHHLGGCFNGGGNAGAVQLGIAAELAEHDLLPMFDSLGGTSVGAVNAGAAAANQLPQALAVYEALPGDNFVAFRRLFQNKGPIMDLGILATRLVDGTPPLDTQAIIDSPTTMWFSVARADTLEQLVKSTKDPDVTPDNLLWWILRGAHVPAIAGKLEQAPRNSYVHADSGLEQLPDEPVLCDGGLACVPTTVTALETAKHMVAASGEQRKISILNFANGPTPEEWGVNPLKTNVVAYLLRKYGKQGFDIMQHYRSIVREQTELNRMLHTGQIAAEAGATIEFLYINQATAEQEVLPKLPGFFTQDPRRLRYGYYAGRNAARKALGEEPLPITEESLPAERTHQIAARQMRAAATAGAALTGTGLKLGQAYAKQAALSILSRHPDFNV